MHHFVLTETFWKHIGNIYPYPYLRNTIEYTPWIYSILLEVYFEGLRSAMYTLWLREVLISKNAFFSLKLVWWF